MLYRRNSTGTDRLNNLINIFCLCIVVDLIVVSVRHNSTFRYKFCSRKFQTFFTLYIFVSDSSTCNLTRTMKCLYNLYISILGRTTCALESCVRRFSGDVFGYCTANTATVVCKTIIIFS